ncbi:hypothetical protein Q5H92_26450 [Hymenobacter sp. M29]|uniref:Uncharacterized protein n=1 Tax=Hymenobacter mellowenesis TaxID=3063995 RepID=A0ABT9AJ85_9BACT|nr:hypothetical protein [Hymenobacter sp. M29]MDO7849928.1 hypothetical protein [Hymenobacter sp. M29]
METPTLTLFDATVRALLDAIQNPDLVAVSCLQAFPEVPGRPAFSNFSANVYDISLASSDLPLGVSACFLSAETPNGLFLKLGTWLARQAEEQPDADRAADAAISYAKEAA